MKLQNLSIIFIIIMLPIILVVSYYLNLQKSTLSMQMSYDQKLLESTKEAIEAFEVNTTEWNEVYSNLSDSKRRDVTASINTFITSLSNNLGISGVAKENLLSYIPAIAFTLYDGYYVYAPTYTPVVATKEDGTAQYDNATGNLLYKKETGSGTTDAVSAAKTEYKHTLTTHLPYSKRYTWGANSVVIEYTLDNYIKVYGKIDGKVVEKEGNLIYVNSSNTGQIKEDKIDVKWNGNVITAEELTEQVMLKTGLETYRYVYDIQNEKYYYEDNDGDDNDKNGKFFRVVDGEKVYLNEDATIGDFDAKYRKVIIISAFNLASTGTNNNIKVAAYQLLNGTSGEWFVDLDGDGTLDERITNSSEKELEFSEDGEVLRNKTE